MARIGSDLAYCAHKHRDGQTALVGYDTTAHKVYLELSSGESGNMDRLDNGTGAAVYRIEVGAADEGASDVTINDDGTYLVTLIHDGSPAVYHGDLLNGFTEV